MKENPSATENLENSPLNPHLWVSKFADYLYSYAIARLSDKDEARDLVQETFLAALEGLERFEGRSSEKTWLTSILRKKIIDVYRKRSSEPTRNADVTHAARGQQDFFDQHDGHWNDEHRPIAFGIEQTDALENKEFQKILQTCMQKLPALWLSVFTMKHMDDEPTSRICTELKITSSNFWVIIHRAKVNLRACLQKNWI